MMSVSTRYIDRGGRVPHQKNKLDALQFLPQALGFRTFTKRKCTGSKQRSDQKLEGGKASGLNELVGRLGNEAILTVHNVCMTFSGHTVYKVFLDLMNCVPCSHTVHLLFPPLLNEAH